MTQPFFERDSKVLTPAAFAFVLDSELKRADRYQNYLTLVTLEAAREWEGMTAEEAAMFDPESFQQYKQAPEKAVCPNGERLTDAQARMIEAIKLVGERHGGERIAAVTHAVMIRLVAAKLPDLPGDRWRIPVGRGSLTRFEVQNGEIRLMGMPAGDDVD